MKRHRNNELLSIQSGISSEIHKGYVGRKLRVFVESVSRKAAKEIDAGNGARLTLGWEKPVTQLAGRTDGDLIVVFDGDSSLIGSVVEVEIENAAPLTLFGKLIQQPVPV